MAAGHNVGQISASFRVHAKKLSGDLAKIKTQLNKELKDAIQIKIDASKMVGDLSNVAKSIERSTGQINKSLQSISTTAKEVVKSVETSMKRLQSIQSTGIGKTGTEALKTIQKTRKKQIKETQEYTKQSLSDAKKIESELKEKLTKTPSTQKKKYATALKNYKEQAQETAKIEDELAKRGAVKPETKGYYADEKTLEKYGKGRVKKEAEIVDKSAKERKKKAPEDPQQQMLQSLQTLAQQVYTNILNVATSTYQGIIAQAQAAATAQRNALKGLNISQITTPGATTTQKKTTKPTKATTETAPAEGLAQRTLGTPPLKLHIDNEFYLSQLKQLASQQQSILKGPIKTQVSPSAGAEPRGAPPVSGRALTFNTDKVKEMAATINHARNMQDQYNKALKSTNAEMTTKFSVAADGTVKAMHGIADATKTGMLGLLDFQSMAQKIVHYVTFSIGVTMVMAVRQAFQQLIQSNIEFEKSIVETASVSGYLGASFDVAVKSVENLSLKIGRETVYSANVAADALYSLASSGVDVVKSSFEDLIPIIEYATATNSEIEATFQAVTKAMRQFSLRTEQTQELVDSFTGTITNSYATMDKLAESYKYVGAIAGELGQSFHEINAVLGTLYDRGLEAGQSGQRLNMIFTKLLKPTDDSVTMLDRMGLTLSDINPYAHDLTDILYKLRAAQFSAADAATFFRARTAAAALILVSEVDKIARFRSELELTKGLTQSIAEKQLATMSGQLEIMKNRITEAGLSLKNSLTPLLHGLASTIKTEVIPSMKGLYGGLGWISDSVQAISPLIKALLHILLAIIPTFATFNIILYFTGIALTKLGHESTVAALGLNNLKVVFAGLLTNLLLFASPLIIIANIFEDLKTPIYTLVGFITTFTMILRIANVAAMNNHKVNLSLIGSKLKLAAAEKYNMLMYRLGTKEALKNASAKTMSAHADNIAFQAAIANAKARSISAAIVETEGVTMKRAAISRILSAKAYDKENVSISANVMSKLSNMTVEDIKQSQDLRGVAITHKYTLANFASVVSLKAHAIATAIATKAKALWNATLAASEGLLLMVAIKVAALGGAFNVLTAKIIASTVAAKALAVALAATGVGLLVVGAGLVAANWEGITNRIGELVKGFTDFIGLTKKQIVLNREQTKNIIKYKEGINDIIKLEKERAEVSRQIFEMQAQGIEDTNKYSAAVEKLNKVESELVDTRRKLLETGQDIIIWLKNQGEKLDESIIAYIDMQKSQTDLTYNTERLEDVLSEESKALDDVSQAQRRYGLNSDEASSAMKNYNSLGRQSIDLYKEKDDILKDLNDNTNKYEDSLDSLTNFEKEQLKVAEDIYDTNQMIIEQEIELKKLRARQAYLLNAEANWTEMLEAGTKGLWEQLLKLLEVEEKIYKLRRDMPKRMDELFQALAEYGLVNQEIIDGYKDMKLAEADVFKKRIGYFNIINNLTESERKLVEDAIKHYYELMEAGMESGAALQLAFGHLQDVIPSLDLSELGIIQDYAEAEYTLKIETEGFKEMTTAILDSLEAIEALPAEIQAALSNIEKLEFEIKVAIQQKDDIEDEIKRVYDDVIPVFTALWDVHAPTLSFPDILPPDVSLLEGLDIASIIRNLIGEEQEVTTEFIATLGVEGEEDIINTLRVLDSFVDMWSEKGLGQAQVIDLVVYGVGEVWDAVTAFRNLRANVPELNSVVTRFGDDLSYLNSLFGTSYDQVSDFSNIQLIAATAVASLADQFRVTIQEGQTLKDVLGGDLFAYTDIEEVEFLKKIENYASSLNENFTLEKVEKQIRELTDAIDPLIQSISNLVEELRNIYGITEVDTAFDFAIELENIESELNQALKEAGVPTLDDPLSFLLKGQPLAGVIDLVFGTNLATIDFSKVNEASDEAKRRIKAIEDALDDLDNKDEIIQKITILYEERNRPEPPINLPEDNPFFGIFGRWNQELYNKYNYGAKGLLALSKGASIVDSPQSAIIGEDGAEAVVPLEGANRKYGKSILQSIIPKFFPDLKFMQTGGVIGTPPKIGLPDRTKFIDDILSILKDIYEVLKEGLQSIIHPTVDLPETTYTPRMGVSVPVTPTSVSAEEYTGALGATADIRQGGQVVNVRIYVDAADFDNAILTFVNGTVSAMESIGNLIESASESFNFRIISSADEFNGIVSLGGSGFFNKVFSSSDTFKKDVTNSSKTLKSALSRIVILTGRAAARAFRAASAANAAARSARRVASSVNKNAQGGIYKSPSIGMFGEEGAEAIIPLEGTNRKYGEELMRHIIPKYYPELMFQRGAMFTGGGGGSITNNERFEENYNVLGPVYVNADNAREFGEDMKYRYRMSK